MSEHSGSGDVSRSLVLMWRLGSKPGRGPKPLLTLEQIVDRAIDVADAEGLEAVSMRRVAAELGVGTMSLYRYVPGKAELLDLMLDRVSAPDSEDFPTGWRDAMEHLGRGFWRLYTTHPWLPFVDQTRPVLGPNALHGLEIVLASLSDTGLTDREKVMMIDLIDTFVAGVARAHNNATFAESRTGVSTEEFWRAQAPVLHEAMAAFPLVHGLDEDAFAGTGEAMLEFGLRVLLDGLSHRVDQS